jgi:hypothetical protein
MLCSGQLGISNTCIIKKIGHRALEVLVYLQSKNTQSILKPVTDKWKPSACML